MNDVNIRDWLLDQANPCSCGNGGEGPWYRTTDGDNHILTCTHCGHGYFDSDPQKLLDRWNNDNPPTEPSKDQTWQQAQELAQAGKEDKTFGQAQDELLTKIIDQKQLVLNAFYAMFVKKTADELPNPLVDVLFWTGTEWWQGHIGISGAWYTQEEMTCSYELNEVKYWLPLPTFNPESEG